MADHVDAADTNHDVHVAHQWIVHMGVGSSHQLCKKRNNDVEPIINILF